jgi:hypothetical protein
MSFIEFELPIYYEKRKNKKILVGFNQIKNLNRFTYNDIKKYYENLVIIKCRKFKKEKFKNYIIDYTYFYKNSKSDLMNVISVIDKFVQDGLIKAGIILDDTVENNIKVVCNKGKKEKINHKIIVKIKGVDVCENY